MEWRQRMSSQRFVLKRKAFIILLIVIFNLSGCGQSENNNIDSDNLLSDKKLTETENKETDALPKPLEVSINTNAKDIYYNSEDDINLFRSLHRCESDGKNIYLVHGEPDLYIMPIGTDEHNPANIDNPAGMNVCQITVDIYGRIHLLIVSQDNKEWFIYQLDESYQVDRVIDISAYIEQKRVPPWFLIDKDGTYYLQWLYERNGIIVDSEGVLKHRTTPESLGTVWIYEAAVGKDGEIYLVHGVSEEKEEIAKLDVKNGLIENVNPAIYFPGGEIFSLMSSGTDTNLLLFSPLSGVWACDTENGTLENRVPISGIGFSSDMEFWPFTFLPDGRLFLGGSTISKDNADDGGDEDFKLPLLKYIPVGK